MSHAESALPDPGSLSTRTAAVDAALASYVPVVVQNRMFELGGGLQQARLDTLRGALLFADISGFTALTERLAARGPAGIELLVRRLNGYFGSLIDVILAYGGDVLKFAGDALVVVFTEVEGREHNAVLRAAACSLAIQKAVAADRESEDGLVLSLKIAVAVGELACAFVGGVRGRWEMVVYGPPLLDAGNVAGKCEPGAVVLSASAWTLIAAEALAEPLGAGVMRLRETQREPEVAPLPLPELTGKAAQAAWSFVPYAIRAKLNSGQGDWLAELRKITVIFVTLPGHASDVALSQTQELMTRLQQLVYRLEGSVNKISVDDKGLSLIAVLGMPPLSHEDDPRRGLLLALEMHDLMVQLKFTPLIGVTTGRAFCGVIGNARRREYTMIGDIVNLSARLMVASAGSVLCDQATRDGAAEHFEFEPIEPLKLKGKSVPVAVYKPARRTTRRSQASNSFFGRIEERAALDGALQQLASGHSAVFVIEGDPGIGKSRLLAEVQALAAERGLRRLQGDADSIERTSAYVAWRGLLGDLLGIDETVVGQTLPVAVLARLAPITDLQARVPLLNDILPLGLDDSEFTRELEGEVRAAALRALLLELLAGQTPLLIVIDDAQWLDSASWALLMAVVRGVAPLLLVCATRPVPEAEQGAELRELLRREQSTVLRLEGLAIDDVAALIRERLGVEEVSVQLVSFVFERTQGNAFFIEQLVLALRDARLIEISEGQCQIRAGVDLATHANLPDTVEGVITQRIDHLDPTEQLSLKVASVVGRAFGLSVINAIFPIKHLRGQLQPHLDTLARQGLTRLEHAESDPSYLFRQILTQEVAYNLMLFSQRRELHLAVADWYESNFSDRAPFYALLAHHLVHAGTIERAVRYLILAGDQALAKHACAEAVRLFGEAIRLDTSRPEGANAQRRAHCHLQLGHASYLLGRLGEGIVELRRGLAAGGTPLPSSRAGKAWAVLKALGVHLWHRRFPARLQLAPQEHDPISETAHAYRDLGRCHYTRSEIVDLLLCGLRGLNFAEALGPSPELAEALATMSVIASAAGRRQAGAAYAARADALLPLVNDAARRANLLFAIAVFRSIRCEWEAAIALQEEVIRLAESISNWRLLQNGLYGLARAATRWGRLALGNQTFERLERLGRTVDNGQATAWGLSGLLQSQSAPQLWELRIVSLRALLQTETTRDHLTPADFALCRGAIALTLMRLGRLEEAELEARYAGDIVLGTDTVATHLLDPLSWAADVHLALWKKSGAAEGARCKRLHALGKPLVRFAGKYAFAPPIAWRIRGELRCLEGATRKGLQNLRTALTEARRQQMPCEAARCHHALAEFLPAGSERELHREQARLGYEDLGLLADLVRLNSLG